MSDRPTLWIVSVLTGQAVAAGMACGARPPASPPLTPAAPASIHGVATDSSGAVLPGLSIEAVSQNTGEKRVTTTDANGRYRLSLSSGPVLLRAELLGFKTLEKRASPKPGEGMEWSPQMELGEISEACIVTAASFHRPAGRRGVNLHHEDRGLNTEGYAHREESRFREVSASPLSTFSVDVDRASYANVRRFLNDGRLPPADAVRIEEMLNYFPYEYASPSDGQPFAAHVEIAAAPWKAEHRLVRIGLKAHEVTRAERPASNLVFLVDVSGSMQHENKLPLVQQALGLLVDQLDERDHVAIVVYAGAAGVVLPPTPGDDKPAIQAAIERLEAGGSTNGGEGIRLAYELATRHLVKGGVNRVILATDGDFNVGVTDEGSLVRLLRQQAQAGVFLSVLGFGMGNYQDGMLETLADEGDGNYAYIDTLLEARKALVEELTSTLVTVAKDVKIQVEFNPLHVRSYRLIGYENRLLDAEDFGDDAKDAGEVGAGHQVTALYEIVPPGIASPASRVDALVYSKPRDTTAAAKAGEILRLKLRYKGPGGGRSRRLEWPVFDAQTSVDVSVDFSFASAVAAFGMLLRESPHRGTATPEMVTRLAERGKGPDRHGYRAEFLSLVAKAQPPLVDRTEAGAQ